MRHGRCLTALLVVALLWASTGTASVCSSKGASGMDCCKSSKHCGTGMKKPDCCRFEPASPTPQPTGIQTSPVAKGFKDGELLASLEATAREAIPARLTGQALALA
ncbi:MAG TPA: hypothetical protein VKL61_06540, partial [Candidatus Polarisedimenticolia bacterium]|nr:hypothetical protein [Candidatus Polarisedimenticolia bacterium]